MRESARARTQDAGSSGRGQPLSFGEISWFDVRGEIQRCDWSVNAFFCMFIVWISRPWVLVSQSQRYIGPCTSNNGISPNDSGWPLPDLMPGLSVQGTETGSTFRH